MSILAPVLDPALQQFLHRLGRRILHERMLAESADRLSDDDLERLQEEDEADLKSLAELPATTLAEIRAKAAPLADRELEDCITHGEMALILSILADLTR